MASTPGGCPRHLFHTACQLWRPTTTTDDAGGSVTTWNVDQANMPCRVQPTRTEVRDEAGQLRFQPLFHVYCAAAVAVRIGNRLTFVDGQAATRTLTVEASEDVEQAGRLRRLICRENVPAGA